MSNKPSLVLARTEEGRFLWSVEEYTNSCLCQLMPVPTVHAMQAWCQPRPCPLHHFYRLYSWGFILLPKEVQLSCRGNRNTEVKKVSTWIERFSCETSRNTDVEQHKTQESQKNIHTHTYMFYRHLVSYFEPWHNQQTQNWFVNKGLILTSMEYLAHTLMFWKTRSFKRSHNHWKIISLHFMHFSIKCYKNHKQTWTKV